MKFAKSFVVLPLGICLATTVCHAAPKVLLAQADTAKIAQVKSGTLKSANASWWGFNKDDATDCLQSAINSGVPKLIVDNTGSDWIINKPIQLASNQEIVFADGVVIQTKKGFFKGTKDSLFEANKVTNLSLIGQGNATLRMYRADYDNPKLYEKAEWRHGISLIDCSDIVLRGLTVEETGGDGLYLGASSSGYDKNVLVENCIFDKNYRQGISVISAEDLTIRNCKLNRTKGTNPQFGIDFEPNTSGQRLVNCVLEDSELIGNSHGGVNIYVGNLSGKSQPLSITIKNCKMQGNATGMSFTGLLAKKFPNNPVKGTVLVEDCTLDHEGVTLRNAFTNALHYIFKNNLIDFSAKPGETVSWKDAWRYIPFTFTADEEFDTQSIGGIEFDNTVAKADPNLLVKLNLRGQAKISDEITGALLVENNGQKTAFDVPAYLRKEQAQMIDAQQQIQKLPPAIFDVTKLQAPPEGAPRQGNDAFYTRDKFTFLQYAQKGEQVTLNVAAYKVYAKETQVELLDPSGQKVQTYTVPYDGKPVPITFTAEQTALYRLVRTQDFSQRIDITSANPGNGYLIDKSTDFLPTQGRIYFQVPAGVKEFTLGVNSDTSVDAALLNPQGKEVERHNQIGSLQLFTGKRSDAAESEIWSLDITHAVWAATITMYAPLVPIISTNPKTLLLEIPAQ